MQFEVAKNLIATRHNCELRESSYTEWVVILKKKSLSLRRRKNWSVLLFCEDKSLVHGWIKFIKLFSIIYHVKSGNSITRTDHLAKTRRFQNAHCHQNCIAKTKYFVEGWQVGFQVIKAIVNSRGRFLRKSWSEKVH